MPPPLSLVVPRLDEGTSHYFFTFRAALFWCRLLALVGAPRPSPYERLALAITLVGVKRYLRLK